MNPSKAKKPRVKNISAIIFFFFWQEFRESEGGGKCNSNIRFARWRSHYNSRNQHDFLTIIRLLLIIIGCHLGTPCTFLIEATDYFLAFPSYINFFLFLGRPFNVVSPILWRFVNSPPHSIIVFCRSLPNKYKTIFGVCLFRVHEDEDVLWNICVCVEATIFAHHIRFKILLLCCSRCMRKDPPSARYSCWARDNPEGFLSFLFQSCV